MKLQNAIKKLSKVTQVEEYAKGMFRGVIGDSWVGFCRNGSSDEITCIHTMRVGEESDSMTDYFPQIWHDNLTQAINFCK